MLCLSAIGFPVDMQLLDKMKNVLARMHSKKGQHNVLYHQMRISIMHHYTALGGATFSKNGREIFTCEKFPFFPMDPGYFCDTYMDEYLADPTPLNSSA